MKGAVKGSVKADPRKPLRKSPAEEARDRILQFIAKESSDSVQTMSKEQWKLVVEGIIEDCEVLLEAL